MAVILPLVAIAFLTLILIAFTASKATITEKTESLMHTGGMAGVKQILTWESKIWQFSIRLQEPCST